MCMFVILLVLCSLVIQCGCHWSQLKATYLLTSYLLANRLTDKCTRTTRLLNLNGGIKTKRKQKETMT